MNNENKVQEGMAMEIIGGLGNQLKNLLCITKFMIIAFIVTIIGLLSVNYRHALSYETVNRQWLEYLSQYDFVSQEGDGYNYFNSDVEGDVNNNGEAR